MSSPRELIVRTQQDEKTAALPQAVKTKIEQLSDTKIFAEKKSRSIKEEEDLFIHYKRRIDILAEGVELILETDQRFLALKPKEKQAIRKNIEKIKDDQLKKLTKLKKDHDEKRKTALEELEEKKPASKLGFAEYKESKPEAAYNEEKATIEADPGPLADYQKVLVDYLRDTEKSLEKFIPKKEIHHALSRAEEYALLKKGRDSLCTVTKTTTKAGAQRWMIQIEVPQDPFSEEQKKIFLDIVNTVKQRQTEQYLPLWFRTMPRSERALFLKTLEGVESTKDVSERIRSISSKLRSIPGLANFSKHTFIIMDENGTILTEVTRLRSSMISSRDIQKREKQLTAGQFKGLFMTKKAKEKNKKLKEEFAQLRSDITRHNIEQVIDTLKEEQIKAISELKISSNYSNPFADDVITIPILMQTLITPANFAGPDRGLLQDKDKVIAALKDEYKEPKEIIIEGKRLRVKYEIISTNHPLNPWRFLTPTGRVTAQATPETPEEKKINDAVEGQNVAEANRLITIARDYVDRYGDEGGKLTKVADAIQSALKQSSWTDDRELYLSALEELAVSLMHGISYGSCVSGKDRKGIETMYADAMHAYLNLYGSIPPTANPTDDIEKLDREKFVELFTEIYMTRHQHENAGQNAPGADGLKTPQGYLPKDIREAILTASHNPLIHKTCDLLATSNEPHNIKPHGKPAQRKKEAPVAEQELQSRNLEVAELLLGESSNEFKNEVNREQLKVKPASPVTKSSSRILSDLQDAGLLESTRPERPEPSNAEKELIKKIRAILPTHYSRIKNAHGINQLIHAIDKRDPSLSLADLKDICEKRPKTSKKRSRLDQKIYDVIISLAQDSSLGSPGEAELRTLEILAEIKKNLLLYQKQFPHDTHIKKLMDGINGGDNLEMLATKCANKASDNPIYDIIIKLSTANTALSASYKNEHHGSIDAFTQMTAEDEPTNLLNELRAISTKPASVTHKGPRTLRT